MDAGRAGQRAENAEFNWDALNVTTITCGVDQSDSECNFEIESGGIGAVQLLLGCNKG